MATHLLDAGEPIDFVQDHLGPSKHRVEPRLRSGVGSAAKQGDQRLEPSREIALPV
jgi:hypothetical protein